MTVTGQRRFSHGRSLRPVTVTWANGCSGTTLGCNVEAILFCGYLRFPSRFIQHSGDFQFDKWVGFDKSGLFPQELVELYFTLNLIECKSFEARNKAGKGSNNVHQLAEMQRRLKAQQPAGMCNIR